MIVTIDRDTCVSCGSCHETCPALFEVGPDDSRSRIRESYQIGKIRAEGILPEESEACAQQAADLCRWRSLLSGKNRPCGNCIHSKVLWYGTPMVK